MGSRKTGPCWACDEIRGLDGHHVHPRQYGGPDNGRLVNICKNCHDILHSEAEYYYKHGKLHHLDRTVPAGTQHGLRIRQLVAAVVKAKQLYEAGEADSGEQRRMTQISWDSDEERLIAHAVKKALGFKSLERAIKKLVFDKWMELQR